jgi:hypothetical protein
MVAGKHRSNDKRPYLAVVVGKLFLCELFLWVLRVRLGFVELTMHVRRQTPQA